MKEITGIIKGDRININGEEGKQYKLFILDEGDEFVGKTKIKEDYLEEELSQLKEQRLMIETKIQEISSELKKKNGN